MYKLQAAGEKFNDQERDGLSDAELAVLDAGDEDEDEALEAIAGADDDTDDTTKGKKGGEADDRTDDEKKADAEREKEEAAAKAKEAADKKAAAEAEAKAKAELERKAKEAADAAEAAAKKAGGDAEALKKAREEADRKTREEAAAAAAEAKVDDGAAVDAVDELEDDDDPFVAPYVAPKPENYDARIKELDEKIAKAEKRFADGEDGYDLANRDKDIRAAERDRRELERQMDRHTTTAEIADKAGERHWQWEVNRFMRDVKKNEGIDYADSIRLNGAFDAEVKAIANKPENADKSGRWFLMEAHKAVKAKLKLAPAAKGADKGAAEAIAKAEAARKAKEAAAARAAKGNTDKLPKTLAHLPAAGGADTGTDGDGEFADAQAFIDKGDFMALEAYIAGKSSEWQDRWARHNG